MCVPSQNIPNQQSFETCIYPFDKRVCGLTNAMFKLIYFTYDKIFSMYSINLLFHNFRTDFIMYIDI